jgi:hypothetical protein
VLVGGFAPSVLPNSPVQAPNENATTSVVTTQMQAIATSTIAGVPTIIYSERTKTINTNERQWQTVTIYRKIGSQMPEALASVGGVGEMPGRYRLSPNKRYLSISLETKLDILDLQTKQLRTIFTPTQALNGAGAFSPDSSKLAVVDGSVYHYANNQQDKSILNSIDIATGKDTVLKTEESLLYDDVQEWRPDGTLIVALSLPKGSGGDDLSYFNPADSSIHEIGTYTGESPGYLIGNGMRIALPSPDAASPTCDVFLTDFYAITDPVSKKAYGTVGVKSTAVDILGLSPDRTQVLLKVRSDSSHVLCGTLSATSEYYTQSISGGAPVRVSDLSKLTSSWNIEVSPFIETKSLPMSSDNRFPDSIVFAGKEIIRSSDEAQVIAAYYP